MESSWILVSTFLVILILYRWFKISRHLPPGPWNLPILGYLPWLNPQFPYLTLTSLSEKYGPIYGLYLGNVYTVVLSDVKLIKKIFNQDAASGRAPLYLTHGIMKGFGLICSEGELWKDQRKFVYNTLRTIGASRIGNSRTNLQSLIMHDVQDFVQHVKNQNNQVALNPLEPLRHSLGSTINQLVFGKSWPRDDKVWKWLQNLQEDGTKQIGVAGPLNFLPFLRFLPKFKLTMRFLTEGKQETHEIYKGIIQEEHIPVQTPPNNFIQAFLAERNRRQDDEKKKFYNDEQFHHLLADIFGASLDTTLTTLRWYLLYLAAYPEIQTKLRQHLTDILGNNLPTLDDISSLPYMEASIAEVQRIRSVVPVGIPHGTLEEMNIEGYTIPQGTMIVPLQWAIHMNPQVWEEPERFKPERFINDEGKFFKPESFLPFQAGKRMCVGDELARMFLFLYGATLIQNFQISCKKEDVDMIGECGITLTPKPHDLVFSTL